MRATLVVLVLALSFGCANPQVIYEEGRVFAKAGKVREAAEKFARAVELDPNTAEYRYGFGWTLAKSRLFDQADLELREALRLRPHFPKASRLLTYVQGRIEWRRASYIADEIQASAELWD